MSLAVNMLRNTPTIEHITKGDNLQIRFSQSDEKIWWKCSHADFTTVWDPLTCWLSNGVLKRCFLEIALTKSLTVCNFWNEVAMTIMVFFKVFKTWCRFQKWNKKMKKVFALSPLVICQTLCVFINTLTANDKYRFCNCENL